jgi:hypothetical protein
MTPYPEKRKSLWLFTGWVSIENLKFQYVLLRNLQAPLGWVFWRIHSRADRIQDEIERIQSNSVTEVLP